MAGGTRLVIATRTVSRCPGASRLLFSSGRRRRLLSIPTRGQGRLLKKIVGLKKKEKKKRKKEKRKKKTYRPRGVGLLPVHLGKHLLKQLLKGLVLGALVELADEVATGLERVGGEG